MEMKPLRPREVEDSKDASLTLEETNPEVVVAEAEKLTDDELTLIEHGQQLLSMAKKAARADKLDRDARAPEASKVNLPFIYGTAFNSWAGIAGMEGVPKSVNLPILVAAATLSFANIHRVNEKTALSLPEGNTIQCLRIAQHTDAVRDGKVLFAVHPRGFGNGEEASDKARQSMADALEVIGLAHTMAKDDTQFGGVVVAGSVARHAGINVPTGRSYKEIIDGIAEEPANVPYDEHALILPMESMAKIVERLRQDPAADMGRVLDEIAKRHPGMRQALVADHPAIVSTLHGVLQRIAYSEGRNVRWEKDMETIGAREVWTGVRYKVAEDIIPMLDKHDPYNPRLIYRSAQTGEERMNQDLRSATGGVQDMSVLMSHLENGSADDLKLVRMALELLESKSGDPNGADDSVSEQSAVEGGETDTSQDPQLITLGEGVDKWKHRRRHFSKLAMGSAALLGAFQTAILGIGAIESDDGSRDDNISRMFQVENHGLPQESPYWARDTGYVFKNGQWIAIVQDQKELNLPRTLASDVPHLTVKTTLDSDDLTLPIEEGTDIASLRVYDEHRKPVDVKTYQKEDGVIVVDGNETTDDTYLEYDLVDGDGSSVQAIRPVIIEGDMYKSYGWQETFKDAADSAGYIRDTYTYDNSQKLKDTLSHTHGPSEYANHLLDTERCQCLQCNTHVALMESQVRPEQKLALVSGYLHPRRQEESHSYLVEGHAWLNDGRTIDATATRTDAASEVPKYDDTATLDKQWERDVKKPLNDAENEDTTKRIAVWSLVGLAAVGLVTLEARFRPIRRATNAYLDLDRRVTAAMDIHPDDARQLMGWQAYGEWGGRIPEIGEDSRRDGAPKEENIPMGTLQEIAKGGFRASGQLTHEQQRGLRRTAKAMLRARKNQPK